MPKPRYLTPSKISLLVLINLYCSSKLPSSATIPVLSFILSHSLPAASSAARSPRPARLHDGYISIQAFEDVLQGYASSIPGRTLLDDVLMHMWQMHSVDSLFDLFDRLGSLLVRPREDGHHDENLGRIHLLETAPVGALVRRARLEFSRLPFDDVIRLWCAFLTYRAPTVNWAKRLAAGLASSDADTIATDASLDQNNSPTQDNNPTQDSSPNQNSTLNQNNSVFEVAYSRLLDDDNPVNGVSADDIERMLEFQLERLQRK
ncbi:APC5 protein [Kalmusia sp. IMI 367209]|nr:APC5 protein [Kalmusia sp. IMI 367209]